MSVQLTNSISDCRGDFSCKRQDIVPSYGYHRLIPQTAGGAVQQLIIDNNVAGQDVVFDIPAKVLNFYESSLDFVATFTAAGANRYNFIFNDLVSPISEVELGTIGGETLCRLLHVERYTKIVSKAEVKCDDLEYLNGSGRFCVLRGLSGNPIYGDVEMSSVSSPNEPQYNRVGLIDGATTLNVSIPMHLFRNTILAMNKDFYFNEVLQIRFKLNGRDSWGHIGGDGAVPVFDNPATNNAVLPGNITLTNVRFNLALERNPLIYIPLVEEVKTGGKQLTIPYVHSFMQPVGAATFQTVTVRLNGNHGNYLKKIYHTLNHNTETGLTRYLTTNVGVANIVSYTTSIDSTRLQENEVVIANDDDWRMVKPFVKGTQIDDMEIFRYNWFALSKFDHPDEDTSVHCLESGMPLNTERIYNLTATTAAAAFRHYIFAVVTKTLTVSHEGIMVR